jgi:dihydrofolate synthase/folylpolyglutamate synthase
LSGKSSGLENMLNTISNPEIQPGLSRMARLLSMLEHPERDFMAVHVVGTNGKGSISAMIESIFMEAGYRTCMYTSPHLVDICERLRFSGSPVPVEDLLFSTKCIEKILKFFPAKDKPTYFEVLTAAAFLSISRYKPDLAIIEAGMGGRLDATNIVKNYLLTVISSIGIDHSEFLGSDIEDIALEKFLVLRPGGASIYSGGDPRLENIYKRICIKMDNQCMLVSQNVLLRKISVGLSGNKFEISIKGQPFQEYTTGLGGNFQITNGATAICSALQLSGSYPKISQETIKRGLENAKWPGRLEIGYFNGTSIIIDGAHNLSGILALIETLSLCGVSSGSAVVFAAMKDKDLSGMIRKLSLFFTRVVFTSVPGSSRSADPCDLFEIALELSAPAEFIVEKDPFKAISISSIGYSRVVCCGSLYLAGAVKMDPRYQSGGNSDNAGS